MVIIECPFCNKTSTVDIPADAYNKWKAGTPIQKAWPEGTATQRETLISGMCPACQEDVFE